MEKYKFWIILICGFITPFLIYLFPVDGGGSSLIFTISVPFFIIISIFFAFIYKRMSKKIELKWKKNLVFSVFVFIILFFTSYSFPCFDKNNLCPCEVVYNSAKVLAKYDQIKFEDILIEKKQSNYPLIVVAQKKYKATFPNKIYYVNYEGKETFFSEKFYAIYFRNGKIYSNNKNLKITNLDNVYVQFSEIYNNENINFKSTKSGFINIPNEYKNYYDNGYEYINLEKEFKNFNLNIRKEPEKDITKEYAFYKILYWIS
jgi:energy-coupling factor transporter transmembrane protein EcfT